MGLYESPQLLSGFSQECRVCRYLVPQEGRRTCLPSLGEAIERGKQTTAGRGRREGGREGGREGEREGGREGRKKTGELTIFC